MLNLNIESLSSFFFLFSSLLLFVILSVYAHSLSLSLSFVYSSEKKAHLKKQNNTHIINIKMFCMFVILNKDENRNVRCQSRLCCSNYRSFY